MFLLYILLLNRITSSSKTLIDKILSNYVSNEVTARKPATTMLDPLAQFLTVPGIFYKPTTNKNKFFEENLS